MNTFLPHADFARSAACLDRARLGKQRVEVLQLLRGSRPHHPASKMWRGFEAALAVYGLYVCVEWQSRGYRDTCYDKIEAYASDVRPLPPWFGDETFHASHRSNLLRKFPEHYSQFGWSEPSTLPYVWPKL